VILGRRGTWPIRPARSSWRRASSPCTAASPDRGGRPVACSPLAPGRGSAGDGLVLPSRRVSCPAIGCFLNGCCGGSRQLPWGVVFPPGSEAWASRSSAGLGSLFGRVSPVHPTQLYEAIAAIVLATVALCLGGVARRRGIGPVLRHRLPGLPAFNQTLARRRWTSSSRGRCSSRRIRWERSRRRCCCWARGVATRSRRWELGSLERWSGWAGRKGASSTPCRRCSRPSAFWASSGWPWSARPRMGSLVGTGGYGWPTGRKGTRARRRPGGG